jgi:hypothetical protein
VLTLFDDNVDFHLPLLPYRIRSAVRRRLRANHRRANQSRANQRRASFLANCAARIGDVTKSDSQGGISGLCLTFLSLEKENDGNRRNDKNNTKC